MQHVQVRKSDARGYGNHGWLKSYHSFSFAEYYDQRHMHFSALRVINDDIIAPGQGFGMHPHRDMEIITYILAGELQHKDSLGNGSVIKAGDVQRMTAGTGIIHSEFNASNAHEVHLLQIWVVPDKAGLAPSYEEQHVSNEQKSNQWCLIAAHQKHITPGQPVLTVHQDMRLYASLLKKDNTLSYTVEKARSVYLHVAHGSLEADGTRLDSGDALMMNGAAKLSIKSVLDSELLLFDLPYHGPLQVSV